MEAVPNRIYRARLFLTELENTCLSMPFENALAELAETLGLWTAMSTLTGYRGGEYTGYQIFIDGIDESEASIIRRLCSITGHACEAYAADGAATIHVNEREFRAVQQLTYLQEVGRC